MEISKDEEKWPPVIPLPFPIENKSRPTKPFLRENKKEEKKMHSSPRTQRVRKMKLKEGTVRMP